MVASPPRPQRNVDIIVREPAFEGFDDLPKLWAVNNPLITFSHCVFSVVITEGERFFIRTVNACRDQIHDAGLLDEVDLFIRQEAMHTRQHIAFNDAIRRFGIDVDRIERHTRRFLRLVERCLTRRGALSVTVFLEHLTTMLAETGYRFPEFRTEWHPGARDFWTWHGLEELEHKAVAFDVFEQAGGGYLTRVSGACLVLAVLAVLPITLVGDWIRFARVPSGTTPTRLAHKLREYPTLRRRTVAFFAQYLFAYFKPDFHPWKNDSKAHIDLWISYVAPSMVAPDPQGPP